MAVDMRKSIIVSCNTYYYALGHDMGIDAIHDFMKPFGFGQKTGIDLENEKTGVLPRRNGSATLQGCGRQVGRGDTISVSNGSGYNAYTPLQIAHAVANLANNGVVMKPHLVKILEDGATRARKLTVPRRVTASPQAGEHRFHQERHGGRDQRSGRHRLPRLCGAAYTVGGKTARRR
jgi:penicillin-binding protein 2